MLNFRGVHLPKFNRKKGWKLEDRSFPEMGQLFRGELFKLRGEVVVSNKYHFGRVELNGWEH